MRISTITIVGLLLFSKGPAHSQGVLVSPGNVVQIDIPSLPYSGPSPQPDYVDEVKPVFTNDLLDPGEVFSLAFYETGNTNSPVSSFTVTNGSSLSTPSFSLRQFAPPLPHPDLPAFAVVSMLAGSINLYSLSVTEELFGGGVYSGTFIVPEPSTATFFVLGLVLAVALFQSASRRKRLIHTS